MSEFFEKSFYGNTIWEWAVSLSIIAGAFIGSKILYWVFGNIIKKITKKSKSELDDLIVDKIEEPIVLAFVLGGFWFGLSYLNLSEGFANFMQKAFYVAITFDVSWMVVRLVDALIVQYLTPLVKKTDADLDDQLLPIIRKTLKAVIWIVAIVIGLNNAGYDVGTLLAGLGLGGLAFAMAAKDSVANLFGGISVFMDKPFKIKDRIQIEGYDGTITDIGLRSTKLKTLAGRIVTIPNHKFTDSYIENVTSEPNRKMSVTLGLTYDTTPENIQKGIEILKQIDKESKYTKQNCVVYFESFGDFSLNISFTYYIKTEPDYWFLGPNDINMQILKKFNEAGLDFAFPTQTIITENVN
ncbi:MAG: mechanosensitive ion channel family protein [Bacteroidales bacterium]|nr:mechanosensitive ion channel family protein [Bacteroidales bacterium]